MNSKSGKEFLVLLCGIPCRAEKQGDKSNTFPGISSVIVRWSRTARYIVSNLPGFFEDLRYLEVFCFFIPVLCSLDTVTLDEVGRFGCRRYL